MMVQRGRNVKKLDVENLDVLQTTADHSSLQLRPTVVSYLRFALKLALECPWLGKIKIDLDVATKKLPFKEGGSK